MRLIPVNSIFSSVDSRYYYDPEEDAILSEKTDIKAISLTTRKYVKKDELDTGDYFAGNYYSADGRIFRKLSPIQGRRYLRLDLQSGLRVKVRYPQLINKLKMV